MKTCVLLICIIAADQLYSGKYPNEGAGITDYSSAEVQYSPYCKAGASHTARRF